MGNENKNLKAGDNIKLCGNEYKIFHVFPANRYEYVVGIYIDENGLDPKNLMLYRKADDVQLAEQQSVINKMAELGLKGTWTILYNRWEEESVKELLDNIRDFEGLDIPDCITYKGYPNVDDKNITLDLCPDKNKLVMENVEKLGFNNRVAIKNSLYCACYFCEEHFSMKKIDIDTHKDLRWQDDGQTMLCPFCLEPTVLASASFKKEGDLNLALVFDMNRYWYGLHGKAN